MSLRRVAVFMGGISSEHDVSLKSGAGMLRELDPDRFIGFPVLISRDNNWLWPKVVQEKNQVISPDEAAALLASVAAEAPQDWHQVRFPRFTEWPHCDIALLALHGIGGEDGRLQGFLEMAGQPFTGSGSFGSALAMDKILSKQIYRQKGIPTAAYQTLSRRDRQAPDVEQRLDAIVKELGLPLLVKHPKGGSSLGMGIARDREAVSSLTREIGHDAEPLLFEAFIQGREITCGVLEGHAPLMPTEIRPRQDAFFNYEAKYQSGRSEEITPAPMPEATLRRIQEIAWQCHHALRLGVYSRTDMMVTETGIYVLESNNLPGFTPTSILPQQAKHAGISYRDLLTHIIETSLARF